MKGAALDGPVGPAVSSPSTSSTGRLSSSGAGDRRRVHQPSLLAPSSGRDAATFALPRP
jgi:hypothetical protein